jgi:hypothetical protein
MFPSLRPFAKRLLVLTLATITLLSPSLVRAEPSIHKIKKRLHRVERVSGVVLCQAGELMVGGVLCSMLDAFITSDDDDDCLCPLPSPRASPAKPASTLQHQSAKSSKPAHPTK